MEKQEITEKFQKKLKIENYSEQTIRNYLSAIKLFLEYVKKLQLKDVTDKELLGHKRLETTQIYTHVSSYSINKIKSPADKLEI